MDNNKNISPENKEDILEQVDEIIDDIKNDNEILENDDSQNVDSEKTETANDSFDEETVKETEKTESIKEEPKKKKKTAKIIIISVILLILAVIITVCSVMLKKFMLIEFDDPEANITINPSEFVEKPEENLKPNEIDDAKGKDFKAILKNWATNEGEKLTDKDIINILLIGSDASSTEPGRSHITDKGNTDAMILVSINKRDEKIKLISFMRDSYTYLGGYDRWAKLNAACANGGPAYLLETIENNYKIEINGYALVDFDSFKDIIDILGGVTVDVPGYVGSYIGIPAGNGVTLNGKQALEFARVRHSDANGDISRVARQRQVINALINKAKGATLSQFDEMSDVVLANIRTNISRKSILGYATKAVTDGWADYEISEFTMPIPEGRKPYNGSSWIWIIDYPLCAQSLQNELYGKTNINLPPDRQTAITVMGGKPQKQS